jgi:tRNA(Ile)-lysidine synthase TilS/MesJ
VRYARDNQLLWREDSTNASVAYKRNYVRHKVLPAFSADHKAQLHDNIARLRECNREIDVIIDEMLDVLLRNGLLDRRQFIMLPHAVSREVMATWLRQRGIEDIDSKMIERAVHASKTLAAGRRVNLNHNYYLFVENDYLALDTIER